MLPRDPLGIQKRMLLCDALRGKSVEMVMKELAVATVSYNFPTYVKGSAAGKPK